jgi:hypothetical protein
VYVAVDGDTIAISASGRTHDAMIAGSVYLFQKDQGGPDNWGLAYRVVPHDPGPSHPDGKMFGWWFGLGLKDGVLAVGAPLDDEAAENGGAAYVFDLRSAPPLHLACQANELLLSWRPLPGHSFAVEHSPILASLDSWQLLPHGRNNPCVVSIDSASGFFRLRTVPPLVITDWPTATDVTEGESVTLQVQATGMGTLSYEWRLDDAVIPEAAGNTLTISSAQFSDQGQYTATVSDACGSVTTEPAALTVLMLPTIVDHPQSQSVQVGDSVTFTVTVTNAATLPIGYRWRHGITTLTNQILNQHTAFYTINNVQTHHAGTYTVVVTNAAYHLPGFLSSSATLEVLEE